MLDAGTRQAKSEHSKGCTTQKRIVTGSEEHCPGLDLVISKQNNYENKIGSNSSAYCNKLQHMNRVILTCPFTFIILVSFINDPTRWEGKTGILFCRTKV